MAIRFQTFRMALSVDLFKSTVKVFITGKSKILKCLRFAQVFVVCRYFYSVFAQYLCIYDDNQK
jgi:hypothetical protein